ncbi:hypothetical protein M5K25_005870 [Dendrobium thyrsiflorum]|uniref:Uncharacterized protein n=1 Tax=Dendrobium thyrsiflorum TaxID=117978 RepID=A0ABD0VGY5_DENTH
MSFYPFISFCVVTTILKSIGCFINLGKRRSKSSAERGWVCGGFQPRAANWRTAIDTLCPVSAGNSTWVAFVAWKALPFFGTPKRDSPHPLKAQLASNKVIIYIAEKKKKVKISKNPQSRNFPAVSPVGKLVRIKVFICTPMRELSLVVARGHFTHSGGVLVSNLSSTVFFRSGYRSNDYNPKRLPYIGGITRRGLLASPPNPTTLKRAKVFICTPMRELSLVVARGHFTHSGGVLVSNLSSTVFFRSGYRSNDYNPKRLPYIGGITRRGLLASPPNPTTLKRAKCPKLPIVIIAYAKFSYLDIFET